MQDVGDLHIKLTLSRKRQVVHRDVRSYKIYLQDKNYLVAKIAGLGLSQDFAEGSTPTGDWLGAHHACDTTACHCVKHGPA